MALHSFPVNGLLPRVDDAEFEWTRPSFNDNPDPIGALLQWTTDIAHQMSFVWPATQNGVLTPPPPQHVLDGMVREQIAGDRDEVDAELMVHPQAGTVAVVWSLPICDFCQRDGLTTEARYDAPCGRPWANMCPDHYQAYGTGRLGTGSGQYLLTSDEVPEAVHAALEVALRYWADWQPTNTGW